MTGPVLYQPITAQSNGQTYKADLHQTRGVCLPLAKELLGTSPSPEEKAIFLATYPYHTQLPRKFPPISFTAILDHPTTRKVAIIAIVLLVIAAAASAQDNSNVSVHSFLDSTTSNIIVFKITILSLLLVYLQYRASQNHVLQAKNLLTKAQKWKNEAVNAQRDAATPYNVTLASRIKAAAKTEQCLLNIRRICALAVKKEEQAQHLEVKQELRNLLKKLNELELEIIACNEAAQRAVEAAKKSTPSPEAQAKAACQFLFVSDFLPETE